MITIDTSLAEPPYDQVKRQISRLVAVGDLRPGDKLPTVRRLAADLGLAPNTVARAYRELEAAGVLTPEDAPAPSSPGTSGPAPPGRPLSSTPSASATSA